MMLLDEQSKKISKKLVLEISEYFTKGLDKELNKVIQNNKGNKTLLLKIAFLSIDVSYNDLSLHQYLPFGLALKAALRTTSLEKRKLRVHLALRMLEKDTDETIIMLIDKNIVDDVDSFEEFTFEDIKPLLDTWIQRYTQRFKGLNTSPHQ
ncbi:MAG: hypothetical protein ACI9TV_002344 [Sulfurimonas sp.]|jgi:hypothetical protein|uniref:hypothetical protein n=1 Tax=Sulfurimonas sp. TaxID=2022749 RepID=UPI0039E2145B